MSAREMIKENIDFVPDEIAKAISEIVRVSISFVPQNRQRPTLEQIYEEYGFDGKMPEQEEVNWGGFVGEEVPW
jgi:hypothetical protein